MKTRKLFSGIGLIIAFAVVWAWASGYTVPGPTLRPSYIKGSWIGYDQDCLLFYRFTFMEKDKGVCVVLYLPDETYSVYRINKWALTNDMLSVDLTAVGARAERMAIKVKSVDQREMRLYASGLDNDWSHQVLLHREDDVLKHAKMCERVARKGKW